MKTEYQTPACVVIMLSAERHLLTNTKFTESTGTSKTENSGGELGSRGASFSFDDD